MTAGWAIAEAERFWEKVGESMPFPRDLDDVLALVLPLAITVLPSLGLRRVESWMRQRGAIYQFLCSDRRLHGCLVAFAGYGIIFVDGADALEERRFTVAHEAAHFLVDYIRPRTAALMKFGSSIAEVLDGVRLPTRDERIDSAIAGCPIGVHVHMLDRQSEYPTVLDVVERRADRLARELLAPADVILQHVGDEQLDQQTLVALLISAFGLPRRQAIPYARELIQMMEPNPSFVEWLRS